MRPISLPAFTVFLVNLLPLTMALHNVTVDDSDPAIVYVGNWYNGTNEPMSYGGGHRSTTNPNNSATFTFVGIGVYYLSPLFSGLDPPVSTLLSLDGGPSTWVNLSSTRDENSTVRWGISGLTNGTHNLSIFPGATSSGQVGTWGEVDGFIVTVLDVVSSSIASVFPSTERLSLASSAVSSLTGIVASTKHLSSNSFIASSPRSMAVTAEQSPFTASSTSVLTSAVVAAEQPSSNLSVASTPTNVAITAEQLDSNSSMAFLLISAIVGAEQFSSTVSTVSLPTSIATTAERPSSTFPSASAPTSVAITAKQRSSITLMSSAPTSEAVTSSARLIRAKQGAIAGGTVSGVALIVAAVIAFIGAHRLQYVFTSVGGSLFGVFLYRARRFVFVNNDKLDPTQISIFLTKEESLEETINGNEDVDKVLIWQTFNIGNAQRDFIVDIPSKSGRSSSAGQPQLGFGTVRDEAEDNLVRTQFSALAPANLTNDGEWEPLEGVDEGQVIAKNSIGHRQRISLGIFDSSDEDPEPFRPFLITRNLEHGEIFQYSPNLYIHAYRTNGCQSGQYGRSILQAVKGDRITPKRGYRLTDLGPLTSWYFRSDKDKNLKLVIGKNRQGDVKKFRNECKVKRVKPEHHSDVFEALVSSSRKDG